MNNTTESQALPRSVYGKPFDPVGTSSEVELIDPYDPPEPDTGKCDYTYDDLYSEFEQTVHHVLENLPFHHPVRLAYWEIYDPGTDARANRNAVRQAVGMFYALPDAERKRVLNGWNLSPAKLLCDRAAVVEQASRETIKVAMVLSSRDAETRMPLPRHISPLANALIDTFTLTIAIGARKMHVIDLLREMATKLECEWENLVGADDSRESSPKPERAPRPEPEAAPSHTSASQPWWMEPQYKLYQMMDQTDDESRPTVIQIRDNPDTIGVVHGCIAVIMAGNDADALAEKIVENPSILDGELKRDKRIIDRRHIVAAPMDNPPAPHAATGFTDADIDAFCESQTKFLAGMGLHIIRIANQKIAMPDGSFRESISYDGDDTGIILGPKIKDED